MLPAAAVDRSALTGIGAAAGHSARPRRRTLDAMKAILQAALAAALSGILVGVLLSRKTRVVIR